MKAPAFKWAWVVKVLAVLADWWKNGQVSVSKRPEGHLPMADELLEPCPRCASVSISGEKYFDGKFMRGPRCMGCGFWAETAEAWNALARVNYNRKRKPAVPVLLNDVPLIPGVAVEHEPDGTPVYRVLMPNIQQVDFRDNAVTFYAESQVFTINLAPGLCFDSDGRRVEHVFGRPFAIRSEPEPAGEGLYWPEFNLAKGGDERPPEGEQILFWFDGDGDAIPPYAVAGWLYTYADRLEIVTLVAGKRFAVQLFGIQPSRWQRIRRPEGV